MENALSNLREMPALFLVPMPPSFELIRPTVQRLIDVLQIAQICHAPEESEVVKHMCGYILRECCVLIAYNANVNIVDLSVPGHLLTSSLVKACVRLHAVLLASVAEFDSVHKAKQIAKGKKATDLIHIVNLSAFDV